MTPKLSEEQRQALAQKPGQPLTVEDPETRTEYVLIRLDTFKSMQQLLPYDDSAPDPRAFYPLFQDAVKDDLDAHGMELYDNYDEHRKTP